MLVRFAPTPCRSTTAPAPGRPLTNHARSVLPDALGKLTSATPFTPDGRSTFARAGRAKTQLDWAASAPKRASAAIAFAGRPIGTGDISTPSPYSARETNHRPSYARVVPVRYNPSCEC